MILETAVHGDEVGEAEVGREAVGTAERLGRERRQVVYVLGPSVAEQRLQERVDEDAVVERLLEPVHCLLTACVLEQRRHRSTIDAGQRRFG